VLSLIRGCLLCLFLLPSTSSFASLQEAQRLLDAGQYAQAIQAVEKVLQQKKSNPEARFIKGLILVQQGKDQRAIRVFTQLTKDYPRLPEPYNNLAVIYATQGNYDKAREALKAALQTHPSYTTAYVNLGDIYAKLASEAYRQALELDKTDSRKVSVKLSLIDKLLPTQFAARDIDTKPIAVAPKTSKEPTPTAAVPATKPTTAQTASTPPKDKSVGKPANTQAVNAMLKDWAGAWSDQDVKKYLSFYDGKFKPYKGSASVWRQQRQQRLKKPAYIKVSLQDIDIRQLSDTKAKVFVQQTYESNSFKDSTQKLFRLVKKGQNWKIFRESVVSQ